MSQIRTGDGLELNTHDFGGLVGDSPRAVVALIHGYGEHAGRYEHVARAWGEQGVAVVTADLRGHGRSPGVRGHIDRFSDYHLDAQAIFSAAQARYPGLPVYLFGHSMGGLICMDWLLSGAAPKVDGLMLSSPFLGIAVKVSAIKGLLGRGMSRIAPAFSLPTGLKGEDVCRDATKATEYDTDPLNNKNATARWFTESGYAIKRVRARAHRLTPELILLYAGDDRITDAEATDRVAEVLAAGSREIERLPGFYHELVNEPQTDRDAIIGRYLDWIGRRLEEAGR